MKSYIIKPTGTGFALLNKGAELGTFETQEQAITSATARHWIEAHKEIVDMVCDGGYVQSSINR